MDMEKKNIDIKGMNKLELLELHYKLLKQRRNLLIQLNQTDESIKAVEVQIENCNDINAAKEDN